MEENVILQEENQQPDCDEANLQPDADKTNEGDGLSEELKEETFIEVKFNKEMKKIPLNEAVILAQKGMKYDLLSPAFEKLKGLSKSAGMTVDRFVSEIESQSHRAQLLKECGGNEKIVDRIIDLEEGSKALEELREIKAEFPHINSMDDLPDEVKTAAKTNGTGLLFENLLYEHRQSRAAEEEFSRKEKREAQSLGSLSVNSPTSAADNEILKGVWGK